MAQYDDLPISRITAVSLISIAVTVITILAVQVVYFGMYNYVSREKALTPSASEAAAILKSQSQSLEKYGVNSDDGRFTIPIEQAIKKVVSQSTQPQPARPETSEGT